MKLNIKDIAKFSGCSVSTVSRVLNQHPYVSEEKKERILKVIAEHDYAPNSQARDLQSGESKTIGVIVPAISLIYFDQIINGILENAFEKGYMVTLLPSNYDKAKEKYYFTQLKNKRFDGIIVTSRVHEMAEIEKFTKYGTIVCCEDTGDYLVSGVYVDRLAAYNQVFAELKAQGKNKIALTLGRSQLISNSARLTFEAYQKNFGPLNPDYLVDNCYDGPGGIIAGDYFSQLKDVPEVVFTNNDETAVAIFQVFQRKGLTVQVIGQSNMYVSEAMGISTIDLQLSEIGRLAFDLVCTKEYQKICLKSEYIKR
ncbi:LacI family DNA-binding transcriptional regulator [Carnobacterium maltaromaticum]|uniref:LacI family DNA-binding transcriptional regulator n=1 Tax=Carnobacterium maltaromaticum TaxID=2751 RepID=A0AAW9K0U7_CARML|nr:LacI family DNA-binding transcriptional regulator [Carnobacterium maltaromaticum]MBC9788278.1 LacI family DNA-binding transcriptional regulator [Carnobacterium maltaromaticum]MDW5524882.1 LacI family DNA-binding transcriptional regulator [Carnobacterium maltaromaticum]MDZ5759495.1 LacI family DNA-binding transcriptional regulator [Carnobacterium maltaromaticum]